MGTMSRSAPMILSLTLITATILLLIGIAAIASMIFNIGPFG